MELEDTLFLSSIQIMHMAIYVNASLGTPLIVNNNQELYEVVMKVGDLPVYPSEYDPILDKCIAKADEWKLEQEFYEVLEYEFKKDSENE